MCRDIEPPKLVPEYGLDVVLLATQLYLIVQKRFVCFPSHKAVVNP